MNFTVKTGKHKVFFSFLLSYIIILLVPLFIGSLAYMEAHNVVKRDAAEAYLSVLQQTRDILDTRLSEVNKMTMQLAFNSYEACRALDYQTMGRGKDITLYHDIPRESNQYYYPLELESRLINLAKAAEKKEIENTLKLLYIENFVKRELPDLMKQLLLCEIYCTTGKVANHDLLDDGAGYPFHSFENIRNGEEFLKRITELYGRICDRIQTEKNNSTGSLIRNIAEYIDSNYMKMDMCLKCTAFQFGISDTYLSQLFKEETGENFSDYLERSAWNMLPDFCPM